MTAVLTACAVAPLRVRTGDFQIFETARADLVSALGTLPEWVEREFHFASHDRISMALFKVTKQSIFAAAASGLTRDRVLGSLREDCSAELPLNVEFEITAWFGQYREIGLRPALLIHCPDAETALRVAAVAGKKVTRLTDTTLAVCP